MKKSSSSSEQWLEHAKTNFCSAGIHILCGRIEPLQIVLDYLSPIFDDEQEQIVSEESKKAERRPYDRAELLR